MVEEENGAVQQADRNPRAHLLEALLEIFPPDETDLAGRDSRRYTKLYGNDPIAETEGTFVSETSALMHRWRKFLDDKFKERGQSLVRWHALFELAASKPDQTLSTLAARFGVVGPSLVGTFNELEAEGLIERRCDPSDRRSKILVLTSRGEELVDQLIDVLIALRNEFLTGVEESEIRLMIDIVNRMTANLDRMMGAELP